MYFLLATARDSTDYGVTSSMAVVSLKAHEAIYGDINFVGITPQQPPAGRVSVQAGIGSTDATSQPTDFLPSRPSTAGSGATDPARQGVTLVVGGAAAADFARCKPSNEAYVWKSLSYSDLSAAEQSAAVESVATQLQNRAVYGQPVDTSPGVPLDIAADWKYTIIEPKYLFPDTWTVESPTNADTPDDNTHGGPSATPTAPTDSTAYGYSAYFQCDVSFSDLWTTQSWGSRWEMPSITTATSPSTTAAHVVSRAGVYRLRELSDFSFAGAQGLQSANTEENWSGMDGERTYISTVSSSDPVSSVPPISVSYSSAAAATWRDICLFLAGIGVSLFASALVSLIRQIIIRRGP